MLLYLVIGALYFVLGPWEISVTNQEPTTKNQEQRSKNKAPSTKYKTKNPKGLQSYLLRIGIGTDTHRLVEGRPLVLGGVNVVSDLGAEGHSDGDALAHAIADA